MNALAPKITLFAALLAATSAQGYAAEPPPPPAHDAPTYEVDWKVDIPVILGAGMLSLSWPLTVQVGSSAHCAPLCEDERLWFIDRPAAGLFDENWQLSSDILLGTTVLGTVGALFLIESPSAAGQDLVVMLESIVVANSLTTLTAVATGRPRPYLYSDRAPLDVRESAHGKLSFPSSHSGTAFAATTAMFSLLHRRFPHSPWPWVWLAVAGATSTLVATGRVLGGDHFPTDVIAGATVGAAAGLIVPWLHEGEGPGVRPVVSGGTVGLAARW